MLRETEEETAMYSLLDLVSHLSNRAKAVLFGGKSGSSDGKSSSRNEENGRARRFRQRMRKPSCFVATVFHCTTYITTIRHCRCMKHRVIIDTKKVFVEVIEQHGPEAVA